MPNSKPNNVPKARVLNNLDVICLKCLGRLKALPGCCGRKLYSEFDTDNTTVDNDISAFNDAICFIQLVFNNMQKLKK